MYDTVCVNMKAKQIPLDSVVLSQEAGFLKRGELDPSLLEILTGERRGSVHEREKLESIRKKMGEKIYTEAVYHLTHIFVSDAPEAHQIFTSIILHRDQMMERLGRDVSVQVAALDYLQSVRKMLKRPTIVESDKYRGFAYRAMVDSTTQAFEKELLDADLEAEIEKARRFGTIFTVLFIDVDNLKIINDSHGHLAGTRAIQHICGCVKRNLRRYDSLYRYGGDEFVVLLPRSTEKEAMRTAERIMKLINRDTSRSAYRIGASIGIASFDNAFITEKEQLLSAADSALYDAKRGGKNTISVYDKHKEMIPEL